MKRRVELIVKNGRTVWIAAAAVILCAAVATGCTFTGGDAPLEVPSEPSPAPTASASPLGADAASRFDATVTGAMEEAGQKWGEAVCRRHCELPRDDPGFCTEASVVSCELAGESVLSSPKYAVYHISLSFTSPSPANFLEAESGNADVFADGLLGQTWEVRFRSDDGETWTTDDVGTGGAMGWGFIDYTWDAEALWRNLRDASPESCYAILPLMDFGEFYSYMFETAASSVDNTLDPWNELWSKLDEGLIGAEREQGGGYMYTDVYPDDQRYRAAYLLYGLTRTDGAFTEGLMSLAERMIEAAPDDFYYALEQTPPETREKLDAIGVDWYAPESWYQ